MQKKSFTLYVGAENSTHRVNRSALRKLLETTLDGYTITYGQGAWKGMREEVAIVDVTTDRLDAPTLAAMIRDALHQEAVAWRPTQPLAFV